MGVERKTAHPGVSAMQLRRARDSAVFRARRFGRCPVAELAEVRRERSRFAISLVCYSSERERVHTCALTHECRVPDRVRSVN